MTNQWKTSSMYINNSSTSRVPDNTPIEYIPGSTASGTRRLHRAELTLPYGQSTTQTMSWPPPITPVRRPIPKCKNSYACHDFLVLSMTIDLPLLSLHGWMRRPPSRATWPAFRSSHTEEHTCAPFRPAPSQRALVALIRRCERNACAQGLRSHKSRPSVIQFWLNLLDITVTVTAV